MPLSPAKNVKVAITLVVILVFSTVGKGQITPSKSDLSYLLNPQANISLSH